MTTLYVLLAAGGVIALGAWLLYRHGKKVQRAKQGVADLKRERKDHETLDDIKPSGERDAIERLRNTGF